MHYNNHTENNATYSTAAPKQSSTQLSMRSLLTVGQNKSHTRTITNVADCQETAADYEDDQHQTHSYGLMLNDYSIELRILALSHSAIHHTC
jgi:hypothetical protein